MKLKKNENGSNNNNDNIRENDIIIKYIIYLNIFLKILASLNI